MADKTVTVKPSGGTYTTWAAAIAGELAANADLVTMEHDVTWRQDSALNWMVI